ncbi:hypothetical protein ACSQ76_06565 [Roseovarius sp. B08]|uniref:hypothetical protein n=1 Tax=Roseovarius sp. B08 TaxID=3449223 RepID=UPI003EDC897F
MSDPVSNAEIEDVLSSIRRLVSVDKSPGSRDAEPDRAAAHKSKPAPAVSDGAKPDAAAPAGGARLVLTPSFRVEPKDLQDEGDSEDHGAEPSAEGEPQHLTLDEWQDAIDESVEEAGSGLYGRDQAEAFDAPDDVHEDAGQGDDAQLKEWLTAEDDRAEEADIWEDADESSVDLSEEGFGDGFEEGVDFGAAAFVGDEDVAFEYAEAGDDAVEEAPEREVVTSELEARIAEVEAAVAARDDQWEPDGASEDPYAGGQTEPLPWEDHVEPEEPVFVSYAAQDEYSAAAEEDRRGKTPKTTRPLRASTKRRARRRAMAGQQNGMPLRRAAGIPRPSRRRKARASGIARMRMRSLTRMRCGTW